MKRRAASWPCGQQQSVWPLVVLFALTFSTMVTDVDASSGEVKQLSPDEGPPRDFCSGQLTLTDKEGVIADHYGGGEYAKKAFCVWIIAPTKPDGSPVDQIVLDFEKFDTEFWFDSLNIFSGAGDLSDNNLLQWLTGPNMPSVASQTIVLNGPVITVLFFSDSTLSRSGFRMKYQGVDCSSLNRCSGNGICRWDANKGKDSCKCNDGRTGNMCEQGLCLNDCLPHGQCVNLGTSLEHCVCGPSFYGSDCNDPYCSGEKVITELNGSFSDHNTDGEYLNLANCVWSITPEIEKPFNSTNDVSIFLKFDHFDTEYSYDFVEVYDGPIESANLIGYFTGSSIPPAVLATTGSMTLSFKSDMGITRTGFTAFFETEVCKGGCGGNGWCVPGGCDCDIGYEGTNCLQTTCPDNCNNATGKGSCDQEWKRCLCNDPWSGPDCSICDADACPDVYCPLHSTVVLTAGQGSFTDHSGGGLYPPGWACNWIIRPTYPYDTLVVSFYKFDLELDNAFLTFIDGDNNTLADFTGDTTFFKGKKPPPVYTSSSSIKVEFRSRAGKTRTGFHALYRTYNCTESCSGHGICFPNDDESGAVCVCDEGWRGDICNISYCPNSCNGHGNCLSTPSGQACSCNTGYFGTSCATPYCGELKVVTGQQGSIADHAEGLLYRSNSNCTWLIKPSDPTVQSITLYFTQFSTELAYDKVVVYDSDHIDPSKILLVHSGFYLPNRPIVSSNPYLFVQFTTDEQDPIPMTGFKASYFSNSLCPVACGTNGYCGAGGHCVCFAGYKGIDCSQRLTEQDARLISPNTTLTDSLALLTWKWYRFRIFRQPGQALVTVTTQGASRDEGGELRVYVLYEDIPTPRRYNVSDHTLNKIKYALLRAPARGLWFIGIEGLPDGRSEVKYEVTLTLVCPAQCPENTTCRGASTNYACMGPDEEPIDGEGENKDKDKNKDKSGGSHAYIALVIILIGAGISSVIVLGGYLYWKYGKKTSFLQTDVYASQSLNSSPEDKQTFELTKREDSYFSSRPHEEEETEMEDIPMPSGHTTNYARFD